MTAIYDLDDLFDSPSGHPLSVVAHSALGMGRFYDLDDPDPEVVAGARMSFHRPAPAKPKIAMHLGGRTLSQPAPRAPLSMHLGAFAQPASPPPPSGGGGGGGGPSDGGGGGGGGGSPSPSDGGFPAGDDSDYAVSPDDGGGDDGGGDGSPDDGGDGDASTSGVDLSAPWHVARGALPSHEAGMDCSVRIYRRGTLVCGMCRCETAYGPVLLSVCADARAIGALAARLASGAPPKLAREAAMKQTEEAVRGKLLEQAAAVPTSPADPTVKAAAALVRDAQSGVNRSAVTGSLLTLGERARAGDPRAAAGVALVRSIARGAGPSAVNHPGAFPSQNGAGIPVGGSRTMMTPANVERIRRALADACARTAHPTPRPNTQHPPVPRPILRPAARPPLRRPSTHLG